MRHDLVHSARHEHGGCAMSLSTSEWYDVFAVREAAGNSPTYELLAHAVAASAEILDRLDTLPEDEPQPNLLFASTRAMGGPVDAPEPSWSGCSATGTGSPPRCEPGSGDRSGPGRAGGHPAQVPHRPRRPAGGVVRRPRAERRAALTR